MRRSAFTLCNCQGELELTQDPQLQGWLAVIRLHLDDATPPLVYPMPPQRPELSEYEAWENANRWASQRLAHSWANLMHRQTKMSRDSAGERQGAMSIHRWPSMAEDVSLPIFP